MSDSKDKSAVTPKSEPKSEPKAEVSTDKASEAKATQYSVRVGSFRLRSSFAG